MKRKLVLASNSPRRSQLLSTLNIPFEVDPARVFNEKDSRGKLAHEVVLINAEGKAQEVAERHPDSIILGVDTVGAFHDHVLEKPSDKADALRMLKMLQGQTHEVLSGICLLDAKTGKKLTHIESTHITFLPLTEEEILAYIATGEPMDKAASYAAQGRGSLFIQRIEGDYFNVVGLPMYRLNLMLREFDINLLSD